MLDVNVLILFLLQLIDIACVMYVFFGQTNLFNTELNTY